jgi:hypothetical protein
MYCALNDIELISDSDRRAYEKWILGGSIAAPPIESIWQLGITWPATKAQLAQQAGVSERLMQYTMRIRRLGSAGLIEAVRVGKVSPEDAVGWLLFDSESQDYNLKLHLDLAAKARKKRIEAQREAVAKRRAFLSKSPSPKAARTDVAATDQPNDSDSLNVEPANNDHAYAEQSDDDSDDYADERLSKRCASCVSALTSFRQLIDDDLELALQLTNIDTLRQECERLLSLLSGTDAS